MKQLPLLAIPFAFAASIALAQQLPPPQNPNAQPGSSAPGSAGGSFKQNATNTKPQTPPQGPALIAPQNAPAARGLAGPQPQNLPAIKNPGKPPAFFAARRQAQIDRKQAQLERMYQFKAARAAEQQKLYEDWHERYLADTPVRVEYYRAQARAYEADAAFAYSTPYFYAAGPPIILPILYAPVVYSPIYPPPYYGTFISWGW